MPEKDMLDLNIDTNDIKNHDDYRRLWDRIGKVEIRMIEKNEKCKHELGDVFVYENPYKRPAGVCHALLHVLDLYIWRIALGFPSWYKDNYKVHKIHCPDAKGTIWAMKRIE